MAKPGSNGARILSDAAMAQAADLSLAKMSDDEVYELQARIELKLGGRCGGCGRRVTFGVEFTSIAVRELATGNALMQVTACSRDDCDFAEKAMEAATVMRQVEFAWPDELGPDAPASKWMLEKPGRGFRVMAV